MLGDMPKSISAAGNASKINELHYQAHAGLGLVYSDTNQYKKAAQAFRKTLSLNPWSPVSSRLNICLDTMKRLELEEDDEL
jgi:tetratricopeptide (TPR) repeat protein